MRICILLSICLGFFGSLHAVNISDSATKLAGVEWVKGGAAEIGGGKWTVVEFWATWCPPCRDSIPHLTELAHKHKNLTIVGISNEPLATVKPFVDQQGEAMDYHVGINSAAVHKGYMDGIGGIPHAFLVDPQGILIWHGHPMAMDAILEKALAGTYDPVAQAKIIAAEEILMESIQTNDFDKILVAASALLKIDALNEQGLTVTGKVFQIQKDTAGFRALYKSIDVSSLDGAQSNNLAWGLVVQEDFAYRNLDLALAFAKQGLSTVKDGASLDTAARVQYAIGDIDAAIRLQQQAVAEDAQYQASLDYYLQAKALQGK